MRTFSAKINDQTLVELILRSLNPKYDHVIVAIEESKDLSVFSFHERMGSLQAHDFRISRKVEKKEEKTL